VGHLTIGAGKVLYQHYPKISLAIHDGSFFNNKVLKDAFAHAKKNNTAINFAGLLTKANVHASLEHLEALLKMAEEEGVANVKMHLFADGKDMPPRTIQSMLAVLPKDKLSTLIGRYYAMDREGNWNLVEEAYRAMTGNYGALVEDPLPAIQANYAKGLSEEFLPALRFGGPEKSIAPGDALVFFNFREDSIREIASAFIEEGFDKFPRVDLPDLHVATFTHYKESFTAPVAFLDDKVESSLGKLISENALTQLRLAETYKYAHVTYFFNGYVEPPYPQEYRVVIPSEPMPHPDEHPAMMAPSIADRLIEAIQEGGFDFILTNFANPDTIAHSGNYSAVEEVVRVLDHIMERVLAALPDDTVLMITSDHGNAEQLLDPMTGRVETQHDPNPVPLHIVGKEFKGRRFFNQDHIHEETLGILSDVAPTILELLGLSKPPDMTGKSLLRDLV
jgi:2,3-bisphosphoglycerate-independent phosphoglycerate mutase